MKREAEESRLLSKPKRYTSAVLILVVVAGIMGSLFAAISMDLRNRDYYLAQAQTIAQNLPINEVTSLQGERSDSATLAYATVKSRMLQIHNSNPDIRFAYLIGSRDRKLFYYADSELEKSATYASPGTPYLHASPHIASAFYSSNEPFIEGPARDSKGTWLTTYAPVKDRNSGQTIALVALAVPAYTYYLQLFIYALVPLLLAAIPTAGLIRDRKLEIKEREIMGLKSQFVSIASHELRSPLNGMLWAIQSLLKKTDAKKDPEEKELLFDMYRSAESSLATVNEILDFSVFDRGKGQKNHKDSLNVAQVLGEVEKTLKLGASEKNIIIEHAEGWPEDIFVKGDVAALKRSFMNILSNALKYSPENSTVTLQYHTERQSHVISISDEGIGIPPEEQAKVLEGYYRASNARKVQASGTGLGLWMAKLIIEEHGGTLSLESSLGKGTTIHAALPNPKQNSA